MPAQFWESLLNSPQLGAGVPLATSTTLTDISPAPQLTIPGNYLYAGSALRLTAFGVFSTTGTPTLLLGFYYGGVAGIALAASGAVATASGVTNVPWRLEATCTVRTVGSGSSGTIITNGVQYLGTAVSAWAVTPIPITALATVGVDTTASKAITVGAQWGTSSASNTITCHQFLCEALN